MKGIESDSFNSSVFRLKIALILIQLVCVQFVLTGQEKIYMFSNLDKDHGLSNNSVLSFLRDRRGFIWMGTVNGLNRYDGYSFKQFKYAPDDPTTIRHNIIGTLAEDHEGKIWIGAGNYLDIYDPVTETIIHADSIFNGKLSYEYDTRWDLHQDRFGHFWYASSKQGLYKYFVAEDSLIKVLDSTEDSLNVTGKRLTGIAEDSDGNIWAVKSNGYLLRINNSALAITDSINLGKANNNYRIFIDSDDDIWVMEFTQNQGIIFIDRSTKTIAHFRKDQPPCPINSGFISEIAEDYEGKIWLGTDHGGINIIDKTDFSVQYILNDPLNSKSLAGNSIVSMYMDHEGFIWLGTFKHGVSYYHKDLYKFDHIKLRLAGEQDPELNDIDNFAEDKNGNIWIGTNGAGLIYYNRLNHTFKQYMYDPQDPNSLSADVIIGLIFDNKDNLWIGTYLGGLNKWDGHRFTRYKHDPDDPESITDDRIWDICEDSDGMLWIATLLGGVNVMDPETGKVIQVYDWTNDTTIRSGVIFTIIEDSNQKLWFGTVNGVRTYDKKTKKFEYFERDPDDPFSLSDNIVLDIHEDSRGLKWIATANGLNIFNETKQSFKIYQERDGLPDNRILTITEDDNHNMWVSTTNGISNIIVENDSLNNDINLRFINYDTPDGLQGKEFNEKAVFKTSKGEILFGGSNGFNLFDPNELRSGSGKPNIIFTDFLVFNKSYSNKEMLNGRYLFTNSITYTDEIILNHSENVFTIEFSNLNYFHPERYKYQYRLEGFNDNWREIKGTERRITYTNLDPGYYLFRVRVSNADGTWNPKEAKLGIVIKPPWWQTWGFRILVFIVLTSLIAFLYYQRVNRLKAQKNLLEKTVFARTNELRELNTILEERQEEITLQNEELNDHRNKLEKMIEERTADMKKALKKAEESDRLKSAFLANMSHEIRTPMNAIVGFSHLMGDDDTTDEEREEFIRTIQKNAETLLVIINDILDISKIEADQINIIKRDFSVNNMLNELYSFYRLKTSEKLELKYDVPKENITINNDETRIRQVLQNLLDNAFKFTEEGTILFGLEIQNNNKTLEFYVKDTGIGIDETDFQKIFIPFSKIDASDSKMYSGTGLGLAICKKIAQLLGGDIRLESEIGKGSTFRFILPVDYTPQKEIKEKTRQISFKSLKTKQPFEILIAEDEPTNYALVEKILAKSKIRTTWAKNGQEAVDYIKQNPDINILVLMDIKMPVLDGIEAFKQIKRINKDIPIIAVTAYAYESEKMNILKNDFSDYIAKPLKPEQLFRAIEKCSGFEIA